LGEHGLAVAEISSFQLESIDCFRPKVAALLNITPDHLNRHKTFENYVCTKTGIFKNQQPDDFAVLNADDKNCTSIAVTMRGRVMLFSRRRQLDEGVFIEDGHITYKWNGAYERLINTENLLIPGAHNVENALAASSVALCVGVPARIIRQGLLRFRGVEHRIELVGEINGVEFYNDSKATNPEAAIKAIEAVSRPVVLIGGGFDKDADFSDWVRAFEGKVRHLVAIGQVAEKIIDCCKAYNFANYDRANSLRDAVGLAYAKASPGDCVLLSPACASYDMFDSYEQRGRMFKQFVKEL
jgi:UDP-N-acetylmuramoylalanine--D-glutamate ligase